MDCLLSCGITHPPSNRCHDQRTWGSRTTREAGGGARCVSVGRRNLLVGRSSGLCMRSPHSSFLTRSNSGWTSRHSGEPALLLPAEELDEERVASGADRLRLLGRPLQE